MTGVQLALVFKVNTPWQDVPLDYGYGRITGRGVQHWRFSPDGYFDRTVPDAHLGKYRLNAA